MDAIVLENLSKRFKNVQKSNYTTLKIYPVNYNSNYIEAVNVYPDILLNI